MLLYYLQGNGKNSSFLERFNSNPHVQQLCLQPNANIVFDPKPCNLELPCGSAVVFVLEDAQQITRGRIYEISQRAIRKGVATPRRGELCAYGL